MLQNLEACAVKAGPSRWLHDTVQKLVGFLIAQLPKRPSAVHVATVSTTAKLESSRSAVRRFGFRVQGTKLALPSSS